jgi:hypothetical protein
MIIPVYKHYFDTFDNKLVVKVKNIHLTSNDIISLQIDNKVYKISNNITIDKLGENNYLVKIDTPNKLDITTKSIKLLIIKKNSHQNNKIIMNLNYTPNIVKNYSNFWLHRVSNNQTLEDISLKYFGTKSFVNKIFEANIDRISDINSIKSGQLLRIPRES